MSTSLLAYIPSPPRGVIDLGPVPLRAYALFIIIGIVVAVWWGDRRWVARGGTPGTIADVAVWAVPFGLVGGRIYHVITDHEKYFGAGRDPIDALKIWEGGLGIWGAVVLGAVGAWIACRRRGIPLPALADAVGAPIIVAQAIGRLGNYFNQELYGRETTLPWGLEIFPRLDAAGRPDDLSGVVPPGAEALAVVHPTFLYELLWNLLVAAVVVWADRRFRLGHGRAFALYVAGYCLGRLGIELLRSDPATLILGIRVNVYTAVILFVAGVAYIALAPRGREDPAELDSRRDEDTAEADTEADTDLDTAALRGESTTRGEPDAADGTQRPEGDADPVGADPTPTEGTAGRRA